jgi:hypothetical protein
MTKDEVIKAMTDTVIDLNVGLAKQQDMSQEQIDELIAQTRPQFDIVNIMLYDMLVAKNVINQDM